MRDFRQLFFERLRLAITYCWLHLEKIYQLQ